MSISGPQSVKGFVVFLQKVLERRDLAFYKSQLYARIAMPWTCLVVVLIALPFGAVTSRRNVFVGVGLCLIMCALFFAAIFACRQLGDTELIHPVLAAWVPVLVFGPLAFSMFDAIHT